MTDDLLETVAKAIYGSLDPQGDDPWEAAQERKARMGGEPTPMVKVALAAASSALAAIRHAGYAPRPHEVRQSEADVFCQPPGRNGKHGPRKFIVVFEDADRGFVAFDDEGEAREFWERANVSWNCYLFGTLRRAP